MTADPFDLLRDELVGAAARQQAPATPAAPARRRAVRGRRPLLALVAVLVLCGTATAAVLTLTGGKPSPPLAGPTPPGTGIDHYDIEVFPNLSPGVAGWCTSLVFRIGTHGGGGATRACGLAPPAASAQIAAGGLVSGLRDRGRSLEYAIVDARVAAVRLPDGRRVVPRPDRKLPFGWRGVVVFLPNHDARATPPPLTLLDARDHPIAAGPAPTGVAPLKTVAVDPKAPPRRACAIHHARLPHLSALDQKVVGGPLTRAVDVNARAFRTCATAIFYLDGRRQRAAVLVDASGPRRTAAPLPGASPVSGRRGVYTASGWTTARRAGRAWLVVSGNDPALRLRLLDALTVTAPRQ